MLDGALKKLKKANSIREGALLLEQIGATFNMPKVGCAHDISHPVGPEDDNGVMLSEIWGWPNSFAEEWAEQNLSLQTPFFLRCCHEHLPFIWNTDAYLNGGSSRRERMVVRFLASVGYANAVIVPVHLPRGRVAAVSWWGELNISELNQVVEQCGPNLLAISHYFIDLLGKQALPGADEMEMSPPSVREIECLTLAAQGLSDVEIAYEMSISTHTIRYYINTVTKRLGARNRTHAVALASQLGIIGISKSSKK